MSHLDKVKQNVCYKNNATSAEKKGYIMNYCDCEVLHVEKSHRNYPEGSMIHS